MRWRCGDIELMIFPVVIPSRREKSYGTDCKIHHAGSGIKTHIYISKEVNDIRKLIRNHGVCVWGVYIITFSLAEMS